jgi:hypothetical protein
MSPWPKEKNPPVNSDSRNRAKCHLASLSYLLQVVDVCYRGKEGRVWAGCQIFVPQSDVPREEEETMSILTRQLNGMIF